MTAPIESYPSFPDDLSPGAVTLDAVLAAIGGAESAFDDVGGTFAITTDAVRDRQAKERWWERKAAAEPGSVARLRRTDEDASRFPGEKAAGPVPELPL